MILVVLLDDSVVLLWQLVAAESTSLSLETKLNVAAGDEPRADDCAAPRELTLPAETLSAVGTTEEDDIAVSEAKGLLAMPPNENDGAPLGLLLVRPVNAWNDPPDEFCHEIKESINTYQDAQPSQWNV